MDTDLDSIRNAHKETKEFTSYRISIFRMLLGLKAVTN